METYNFDIYLDNLLYEYNREEPEEEEEDPRDEFEYPEPE